MSQSASLIDITSRAEATNLIRSSFERSSTPIAVAQGWRSNQFDWPDQDLERFDFPVAIFNLSLHSLRMNGLGKTELAKQHGDSVFRIDDQDWYEKNLRHVLNWFATINATTESLQGFFDSLLKCGVYSIEEMLLVDAAEIELFHEAGLISRTRFWASPETYADLSESAKEHVHGLKLFCDGAIGSRTAAMQRPYIGPSGTSDCRGMLMYTDQALALAIDNCLESKKSLAIHAIGDRAIEQVIQSLEVSASTKNNGAEIRIEHAQMINQELAHRAKNMGLILSMQPNFSTDSLVYQDRLDPTYCQSNNPFRMLIDDVGFTPGKDLVFGSDGMPHGIKTAIDSSLYPSVSGQKLTINEFEFGYCMPPDSGGEIELTLHERGVDSIMVHI